MSIRLRIMIRATQIRMRNGENLDDILNSYGKLTHEDKRQITEAVNGK